MNIGTSAPVQEYPSNVIKFEEQNAYYSLDVLTNSAMGKLGTQVGQKHFLCFMLYLWSMKLAGRKDVSMSLKHLFLITWALLLESDPNPSLLFTLISQHKMNLWKSLSKPALEKARYNTHKESLVLALHKEQTLLSNIYNF